MKTKTYPRKKTLQKQKRIVIVIC